MEFVKLLIDETLIHNLIHFYTTIRVYNLNTTKI